MSRFGFLSACFVAILLALAGQDAMAQGLLPPGPQSVDDMMSPHPLGPLQKFGNMPPESEASSLKLQPASPAHSRRVHAARIEPQTQRRPKPISDLRKAAVRSPARQHELQYGVASSASVLSLAPRTQERRPSSPFCFPFSTIHIQQDERDGCYVGAPAKGRFEELLGGFSRR